MIEQKKYITTGEFAKMMNTTKDTLFHYDKIGLFQPEIKKENDYRYYSVNQMELLEMIFLLRDLGMPLKEIKKFMEMRSPKVLLELLEKEENTINEKIKQLRSKKKLILEQKKRIRESEAVCIDDIVIKEFPEKYYLLKSLEGIGEDSIYEPISLLKQEYLQLKQELHYDLVFTQYAERIKKKCYEDYKEVLLLMKEKPKGGTVSVLPAGKYVVAYFRGDWHGIGTAYERMQAYIKEHGLTVDGKYYEEYLVDGLVANDISDFVTQISVRVLP